LYASCSGSFRLKDGQGNKPEEAITPAPSMKKVSTFSDEKPETSTKPDHGRRPTLGESIERHTKADEWERTELQEIRQRYFLDASIHITLNFYQKRSSIRI